jgi:hypothetical protein
MQCLNRNESVERHLADGELEVRHSSQLTHDGC